MHQADNADRAAESNAGTLHGGLSDRLVQLPAPATRDAADRQLSGAADLGAPGAPIQRR
jgi:hypothetical protein